MTLRKKRSASVPMRTGQAQNEAPNFIHPANRLVGLGFRCWLAGFETQDVNCWETGWNVFAMELGPEKAKAAVAELSCWVREVHKSTSRRIETHPFGCRGFCRDECMAISMIAASQHSQCPAMRACAFALMQSNELDSAIDAATGFGESLRDCGHLLSTAAICDATAVIAAHGTEAGNRRH